MNGAPVSVRGLDVVIDAHRILAEVTLSVERGRFTGIIGRNGSGKSTLIRCMSRTLMPAAGSVTIEGRNIAIYNRRELARTLSVVPQESSRTFEYPVEDVVAMGRYARQSLFSGFSGEDQKACRAAMEIAGISDLAGRRIPTLSGGEWQRVLIARTLAQETGIILLDEPTSHLDVSHQIAILSALHALTRSGTTVIAVFHDLNLTSHYCDHIIALQEGRVAMCGTPSEVITTNFLATVFSLEAEVRFHPVTGKPLIFPRFRKEAPGSIGARVHVISGGGTGSDLLHTLHDAGYRLTAGVLSMNDSDYATATSLGIPCSAEPPFSPISEVSKTALAAQVADADFVIVIPAPVGTGNLANLQTLADFSTAQIFFMAGDGTAAVEDFCGGEANRIISALASSGRLMALPCSSIIEIIQRFSDKPTLKQQS
jgi:iron complex transport system ATP-binding protein